MSASPVTRQAVSTEAIPIKRVLVNDPSEIPSHYSETPGGTLYSTTPGGTKIVYDKSFLMNLRNSPISKTPPTYDIPENITKGSGSPKKYNNNNNNSQRKGSLTLKNRRNSQNGRRSSTQDDDQFQIEL